MADKVGPPVVFGRTNSDHVMIESSHKVVAGWLQAAIEVRCGGLSARFAGRFRHGELHKFAEDVEDLYKGERCTAGLKPTEPYLVLLLRGDAGGRVHVAGEARQKLGSQNVLAFEMELDQADLQLVANALILADRVA